jgi:DNA-binding response OmpR family regulator
MKSGGAYWVGTDQMNASQSIGASSDKTRTKEEKAAAERCTGRLLIVDDEPDICEFLAEELTDQGYECLTANGVDEAVELVKQFGPQAIISDVRMPYKSGIDLLQAISRSENHVPIILISGFTDVSLQQIYQLGAVALFSKPLNIELLLAQIQRTLSISSIPFGSRSSNRSPASFPAQIYTKSKESQETKTTEALICNISRTGIYVQVVSGPVPAVGQQLSFTFYDPKTQLGSVKGTGICRWTHQINTDSSGNASFSGLGVEFQNIESESYEALLNYVSMAGSFWAPAAMATKILKI